MSSAVYYRPDLESPVACRTHAGPRSKRSASLAGIGVNTDAEESITELRRCRPRQIITDEAEMSPAQYLPVPDTGELRSICEAEREPQLRWVPVLKVARDQDAVRASDIEIMKIDSITTENEGYVRTNHPAFRNEEAVGVFDHPLCAPVWVVSSATLDTISSNWLRVGGREVHFQSIKYYIPGVASPTFMEDPIKRIINPRELLPEPDVQFLQSLFPAAYGIRMYICGSIALLISNSSGGFEKLLSSPLPQTIGRLKVRIEDTEIIPSNDAPTQLPTWGSTLAINPSEMMHTRGCLGLRIRMKDLETNTIRDFVTTTTHSFVDRPDPLQHEPEKIQHHLSNGWKLIKCGLAQSKPVRKLATLPGIAWALSRRTSCSSVGTTIYLADTTIQVGTIARMYDKPSSVISYPYGYLHDLSLIAGQNVPSFHPPPGLPLIREFASVNEALSGQPVFTARYNVQMTRYDIRQGEILPPLVQQDLVVATQYTWEQDSRSVARSLLWRTIPADDLSLVGFSGSVLCLGLPSQSVGRAVLFQNFEAVFPGNIARKRNIQLNPPELVESKATTFKGGFILPQEVTNAEIIMEESPAMKPATWPLRHKEATGASGAKRNISNPATQ